MRVDTSALELFLEYLDGGRTAAAVLEHPAYRAVKLHARHAYGVDLEPRHLDAAVGGEESPFYGLAMVRERLPRISRFAAVARESARGWVEDCLDSLAAIAAPTELAPIVIYPIVGYDVGIGLAGVACLNVNWPPYLGDPAQFGYTAIHECCHVVYGRTRPMPSLAEIRTPGQWFALFSRMTQDEGFAVYTPLRLRMARGAMGGSAHPVLADYTVLDDPAGIAAHIAKFRAVAGRLAASLRAPLTRDEYIELLFGPDRLTYRVGCEIVRRIESAGGEAAVRRAFLLPGEEYLGALEGMARDDMEDIIIPELALLSGHKYA